MQVRKIKACNPWLVQLATGMKQKVSKIVKECEVNLNGFLTKVNLNIIPLGSIAAATVLPNFFQILVPSS